MVAANEKVLYVGKAKNLRQRLGSYFNKNQSNPRIASMLKKVLDIQITLTETEADALLLESNLIKQYKTPYNILLRDDKSYPYIYLSSQHDYPQLRFQRGKTAKQGQYFGSYVSAYAVRETLKLLYKLFQLRSCEDSVFANRSRPCLQYQIKRCSAPCTQKISKQAYQQQVQYSTAFLEGKSQFVIDQLVQQMDQSSQAYAFEQAAIYRDQIESLRRISQQQYIQSGHANSDIIALSYQQGMACIHLLSMRHGQNRGSKNFFPKLPQLKLNKSEILSAFISQYYLNHQPPKEILIQTPIVNPSVLETLLSQLAGYKVGLKDKLRGNRLQWLTMANKNAVYALEVKLNAKAHTQARIYALKEALDLSYLPKRLECFDISHTMGEATVASCVVFTREGAAKQEYRRFNIHNITAGDDYAAMRQVLQRRFKGIADNNAAAMSKQPDLVFIDGGKGQVQQALDVMDELNITHIDIIGVAKGEGRKAGLETLIINRGKSRKNLDEHSSALHLIQAIRDESHRFAINAHRQKRHKARLSSPLQQIKGLGIKRRQCLLKQFGGIQALSRASIEEIAKVKGISLSLAEGVYQTLQNSDKA